jgi:hypothetical protein
MYVPLGLLMYIYPTKVTSFIVLPARVLGSQKFTCSAPDQIMEEAEFTAFEKVPCILAFPSPIPSVR